MPDRTRRPPRVLAAIALILTLTGCGASAGRIGTTGIDTLVIPTPAPQAGDFVEVVDNPWFDLRPGTVWRYRTSAPILAADEPEEIVLQVLAEPGTVDGITTTRVSTETRTRSGASSVVDQYAQDRDGNVWWLAREGVWRADEDGGAGLWWPAEPRLGDGWSQADVDPTLQRDVELTEFQTAVTTPAGRWTDAIEATTTAPGSNLRTRSWWVRGVGPVRWETGTGGLLDLVETSGE